MPKAGTQEEWTTCKIGEIADPSPRAIAIGPFGSALTADMYSPSGIPLLRGQDILSGKRLNDEGLVFVPKEVAAKFPACIVRDGDLVFPHRGAIGRTGIVGSRNFLLSSSMMKLTCDKRKVDPRFVFYYFRGPGREELLARTSTVGTPGIGQPLHSLRGIPISYPPMAEQVAISDLLEALDDKIAANDHLAATALELASMAYKKMLQGKPRTLMSRLLTPILGGTPARSDESLWNGSVAWASAKDITTAKHGVILSTSESITELAASKARTRMLPAGTVVLTARGTVGAVARLGIPAAINQSCYGFTPGAIPASCLFFAIENAAIQAQSMTHGSVFNTITMSTFRHLEIPKLDYREWLSVEERIAPTLTSSKQAVSESKKLAAARDELLPLLMSGKVRVREAEKVVEGVV